MKESEYISGFLSYLRESVERLHIAEADEKEVDAQTQDIVHQLELHDDDYHETARIGELLRQVRRKRRIAKNARETLTPVANWVGDHTEVMGSLERTLGELRKIEKRQCIRVYVPRTDILESAQGEAEKE